MHRQIRRSTISNPPSKPNHRQSTVGDRQSPITTSLLRWYRKNGRTLPWRGVSDPYKVLVSEVMLQQTQVSRVLLKFPTFLKRFPTLEKLACARTADVIRAWQGMGYNSRVLRLHQTARTVVTYHKGRLPGQVGQLRELPGIGPYTANAVACFAFGKRVPVVDTNIERVLHRLFPKSRGRGTSGNKGPGRVETWRLAERILPKNRANEWNQALMDLGATICTNRTPKCGLCPLRTVCPSAHVVQRKKAKPIRPEPGRDGTPNRIYRGRVVEALRNLNGQRTIDFNSLARTVKQDYRRRDRRWFEELLAALERDGLIRQIRRKPGIRVSLPE